MEPTIKSSPNSDHTTEGIRVQAAAHFIPDRSERDALWYYAYRVRIVNEGTEHAQLLSRHWVVLDANNEKHEVVGEGVVGRQPDLGPGELFEYKSGCPLNTAWGTMEGTYTFRRPDGTTFEVAIGRFFLVPDVDNADAIHA
ncbi:MAG: Co2+/Mg2+ efflux protein ApaG [Planctomycetota bacterium]|nr:Co2+/Mg2+ efflux protein ApaG [Planctomycetota bacterium]